MVFGAIIATAIIVSIFRCPKYPSFKAWWEAEGLPIWMMAGMVAGVLYLAPEDTAREKLGNHRCQSQNKAITVL